MELNTTPNDFRSHYFVKPECCLKSCLGEEFTPLLMQSEPLAAQLSTCNANVVTIENSIAREIIVTGKEP
jgi:hypothetical protein